MLHIYILATNNNTLIHRLKPKCRQLHNLV